MCCVMRNSIDKMCVWRIFVFIFLFVTWLDLLFVELLSRSISNRHVSLHSSHDIWSTHYAHITVICGLWYSAYNR